MNPYLVITYRLLPLYVLVVLGFMAGRYLAVRKESFAAVLIYVLIPAVIFVAVIKARLQIQYASLPILFFVLCSFVCLAALQAAGLLFQSPLKNILAYASGSGNSGYFGIPVGVALFGESSFSTIVLCSFGFTLYELTLGFYIAARGNYSSWESLRKVIRLPAIYAFALGLICNALGFELKGPLLDLGLNMRAAYSVMGMMMIGLAMSEIKNFKVDWAFTALACLMKFLFWPLLTLMLLTFDHLWVGFFDFETARVVFFMATVPMAANTTAISSLLRTEPEKAAIAVVVTTFLAVITVPLWNGWFSL